MTGRLIDVLLFLTDRVRVAVLTFAALVAAKLASGAIPGV